MPKHDKTPVKSISPLIEKTRREGLRWLCLQYLYEARPEGSTEGMLLTFLCDTYSEVQPRELRCELDYLAKADLLSITSRPLGPWHMELTRQGVDLVEYTIDCPPGIWRPKAGCAEGSKEP